MKTQKHGSGMTHKEIIRFSNRLAYQGIKFASNNSNYSYSQGFDKGWSAACKYFAHELRMKLRECERENNINNLIDKMKG